MFFGGKNSPAGCGHQGRVISPSWSLTQPGDLGGSHVMASCLVFSTWKMGLRERFLRTVRIHLQCSKRTWSTSGGSDRGTPQEVRNGACLHVNQTLPLFSSSSARSPWRQRFCIPPCEGFCGYSMPYEACQFCMGAIWAATRGFGSLPLQTGLSSGLESSSTSLQIQATPVVGNIHVKSSKAYGGYGY